MFCKKCGSKLNKEAKFCRNCGNATKESPEQIPRILKTTHSLKKNFNFNKTFLISTVVLAFIFSIVFGLADGFQGDAVEILFGILILSALIGVLATFIIRAFKDGSKENTQDLVAEDISKYKGLEGWLTLVILGLFVSIGYSAYSFLDSFKIYSNGEYNGLTELFAYDLITSGLILIYSIFVIYLLFNRKRKFPINFIVLLIINAAIQNISLFIVQSYSITGADLQDYQNNATRAVASGLIWIIYAISSKRVKATFVED